MINKKLERIRKKLDNLDNHFLLLIKKRTLLVNQVLLTKKFKNQIVDKKRIKSKIKYREKNYLCFILDE